MIISYLVCEVIAIYYTWLEEALREEFVPLRLLKKSERSTVTLVSHRTTKQKFITRYFTGNVDVYRKLLNYDCPNLPKVYEVASQGNQHIVLEEYIQGDNMGDMLEEALFTSEETREIVRQLCNALWVLHSIGAVHRDIKPENVMLRGGATVLIDFDAARFYKKENENDTQILGTTGFAAPEQYGLSQTDACSDIYSLGILINVMLTGQHPSKQLAKGRWGRIVARCTQVNPKKRYKNVLHLLSEI